MSNDIQKSTITNKTVKLISTPVSQANFLSKTECEELLRLGSIEPATSGGVGLAKNITNYRSSEISWIYASQDTEWIYRKIAVAVIDANKFYGFKLQEFNDSIQVARYVEGGHYSWHMDIGETTATRKLSVSVQLSDPGDYDGGKLVFSGNSSGFETPAKQGTIILFPSYLTHRVTPVTSGVRWSLVTWIHGQKSFE